MNSIKTSKGNKPKGQPDDTLKKKINEHITNLN